MKSYLIGIKEHANSYGLTRSPDNTDIEKKHLPPFYIMPEDGAPHPIDQKIEDEDGATMIITALWNGGLPFGRPDYDSLYYRPIIDFWIRAESAREAEEFYLKFRRSFNQGCYPYSLVVGTGDNQVYISSIQPINDLGWMEDIDARGVTARFSFMFTIDFDELDIEVEKVE